MLYREGWTRLGWLRVGYGMGSRWLHAVTGLVTPKEGATPTQPTSGSCARHQGLDAVRHFGRAEVSVAQAVIGAEIDQHVDERIEIGDAWPLRSLGRSICRAAAWLLIRSVVVRCW